MAVLDITEIVSTDRGDTGRLKPHIIEALNHPEPDRAPFTRFTTASRSVEKVMQMTFQVQEDWDVNRELSVSAASAIGADIAVTNADAVVAGATYEAISSLGVPLNWTVDVDTTPTAGGGAATLSVGTRPLSGTDTALAVGDKLRRIKVVLSEDDTKPDARTRATNRLNQQCTTFGEKVIITRHMQHAAFYGMDEEERINQQSLRKLQRDTESILLFDGQATNTGTLGETVWHTDGWRQHAMRWNRLDCNGTLTHDFFVRGIQQINRLGGAAEKTLMMGNDMAAKISQWGVAFDVDRRDINRDRFGFEIKSFNFAGIAGDVNVVVSYDFEDRNEIAVMDFRGLGIAENIPLTIDRGPGGYGIQTPGQLRFEWMLSRAMGLRCNMPWAQGIFTNITRISAN